jgi:hypothetical protein
MRLKNDPYFPFVALAIIAGLIAAVLSPSSFDTKNEKPVVPANTVTSTAAAIHPAE